MARPGDTPSTYEPNPPDDRQATEAGHGEAYLALATAIEESDRAYDALLAAAREGRISPKTATAARNGNKALRRAAWALVIYSRPTEGKVA